MTRRTVRAATAGDADAIARVWVDMASYYAWLDPERFRVPQADGLVEWIEKSLDSSDDQTTLVAEDAGQVVGFLEAHIIAPRENAPKQLMREAGQTRLIIDVIGVERPSWRHGVGTELMLAAEQWGRQKGAELAVVDTYVDSPVSVPFYERLGYQPRQLSYRKLIP
jgi:GNAT superfamily N-acetyltransferase